jgi:hypothetical protein
MGKGTTRWEMTSKCQAAVLDKLDELEMKYKKVSGHSPTYRIISGTRNGVNWARKVIHIRYSSLKNDIRPISILSYSWMALDWRAPLLDYDFLICGASRGEFDDRIFVFEAKDVHRKLPDILSGRYQDVKRRIHLFQSMSDLESAILDLGRGPKHVRGVITPWEEEVNRKILRGSFEFDL